MCAPTYVSAKSVFSTLTPCDDHTTALASKIASAISPKVPSLKARPSWGAGVALLSIRGESWTIVIGLNQPRVPVAKIPDQFHVLRPHVTRPDHLRSVNV